MASRLVSDALSLINAAREELELEPLRRLPKGIRQNAFHCPLSRALDGLPVLEDVVMLESDTGALALARAWGNPCRWNHDAGVWEVELPDVLRRFVAVFDRGGLPELVDRRSIRRPTNRRPTNR